ncbi:MAG: arginase family protein, partial [Bdellovibrionota bacterium]
MSFDPNSTASAESGIFGLPFGPEESRLHILQVPWEVTTSYGDGAARGPAAILRASYQVDLFDIETGDAYNAGYFLRDEPQEIAKLGVELKKKAKAFVEALENGTEKDAGPQKIQSEINSASEKVNEWVYREAKQVLDSGRIAALLGGDHSTPYGLIRAVTEKYSGDVGILHVDAHADLRDAYQGYQHSHASIMHNVMETVRPAKLVQVGIRDFSPGEYDYIQKNSDR